MRLIALAVVIVAALAAPSSAQQRQATQAEMIGIVDALSVQIETLRNLHIQAAAKAAGLADDNAKLKAQIEELQKRAEPTK